MDRKSAAKIDSIKDTPSLNTTSYLGKILRQEESELPVDMRPIHQLSSISRNPFIIETLTENPVVTEINVIGQGGHRAIERGTNTQSIIDRSTGINQSNVITQIITDHSQMSLKGEYFPFNKKEAPTLVLAYFVEAFLTRNRQICTTSIVGACRPNHSRIFSPGMHKDISGGDNLRSNVRNDVRKADKLDTTVDGSPTDEQNTASSRIEESTPKIIFRKGINKLDSSDGMNLANSLRVQTPDLVSFSYPTIQTDNILDRRSGGVAAIPMSLSLGSQIPSLFAILAATPPLLRSHMLADE